MADLTRRDLVRGAGAGFAALALARGSSGHSFGQLEYPRRFQSGMSRMIVIPAGTFLMGTTAQEIQTLSTDYGYHRSWFDGELPQQPVDLPAYAIRQYPITNWEFAMFCAATGYPPRIHWGGGDPPPLLLDHPVTFVTRDDARAYAAWRGMRLPTEAEWEKAARGTDGRAYPWGNAFDPIACRWNVDPASVGPRTSVVNAFAAGASPYGVRDLSGNVGEWCDDGPPPSNPKAPPSAYVKGGAWVSTQVVNLRPAARNMSCVAANSGTYIGFRLVKDLP